MPGLLEPTGRWMAPCKEHVLDSGLYKLMRSHPESGLSTHPVRTEVPYFSGYPNAKSSKERIVSTYIVVVDDEPDVESMFRQQFRRDLRSGRFVMEFALSAPAALEQVKAIPDPSLILILSDINMPGMTGLEMLPKVKAERPNVPVIMITAYGDDATRKRASELGAAGLLPKPIDFGLLRQEIDQRMEGSA